MVVIDCPVQNEGRISRTVNSRLMPLFAVRPHGEYHYRCDNDDIKREIKNTFVRTNTLIRKFCKCSFDVKCILFRSYCLCLYDVALWYKYNLSCYNKCRSCYNKCIKSFFGYNRSYSLIQVLLETGLQSFDTVVHNSACTFISSWQNCDNGLTEYFSALNIAYWLLV